MQASDFGKVLRDWRKAAVIKQDSLAAMLGVSQSAVSAWETGRDTPGRRIVGRLLDMMSPAAADRFRLDKAVLCHQSAVRAAFDLDGVRLVMASRGMMAAWPQFSTLGGVRLADRLVDEAATLIHDDAFVRSLRRGEVAMVSAVSERHVALEMDARFTHRWVAVFRSYGQKMLVDMTYEPCAASQPLGVEQVTHFDSLTA